MAAEFWDSSPFGEDSIFNPSWDKKRAQEKLQAQQSGEIIEINIVKGDLLGEKQQENILKDNLDPIKYRSPNYKTSSNQSSYRTLTYSIIVRVEGSAEAVYVSVSGKRVRARAFMKNYLAVFDLKIPSRETSSFSNDNGSLAKEGKKEFEIFAEITDFMGTKVYDNKKLTVNIRSSGQILGGKIIEAGNDVEENECGYVINNDYLQGQNVIISRIDNEVKPGGILKKPVLAIVLHRTVGSTIGGAISHSKGTHFYVEADRDPEKDGEIFQAMSLKNSSNHIFSEDDRISHFDVKTNNSIGIEVIGLAYFKKDGKIYQNFGNKLELPDPPPLTKAYIDKNGRENYWDPLTEAQVESTACLVKLLMEEFSIDPNMILTHEEIQSKTAGEGQAVKDAIFEHLIK